VNLLVAQVDAGSEVVRLAPLVVAEMCVMGFPESDEFASIEDRQMEAYREMARDAEHEREAQEWCEALIGDAINGDGLLGRAFRLRP
jgi:hypothetical protein